MQKIACVFSFKMSNWVSCQKIVFNLHKAYQLNKDLDLLNFNYSTDQTADEITLNAQSIVEARPDIILILDHKPHPYPLLNAVTHYLKAKELKPKFIFHIFGDFTLHYPQWAKLAKLLEGYEVEFIVASERQKHLIDKFLTKPLEAQICPFPVAKQEFFYNAPLRTIQRKEWGLKDGDTAFVFSGRLSRQKRIHTLLRAFSEFLIKTKTTKAHLFLYGNTDHIGDHFLGKWELEGEYFRKINKIFKSLPDKVQSKIHFMGSVPNNELKAVYQGADMLVNLSVHNDEDYGMSVAEALCSGLPAIITDWGGLASFHQEEIPGATTLIPVKIGLTSKLMHFDSIVESFEKTLESGHHKNRGLISEKALEQFGLEAAKDIIKTTLKRKTPEFSEFTPFFNKVHDKIIFNLSPYLTQRKNISTLYREIYSSYVRDH
jgi:glycosyltransferase involved in cell wall biosynthesis